MKKASSTPNLASMNGEIKRGTLVKQRSYSMEGSLINTKVKNQYRRSALLAVPGLQVPGTPGDMKTGEVEAPPQPFTFHLGFCAVGSLFGGWQYGHAVGAMNVMPLPGSEYAFYTKFEFAWVVSVFCLTGLLGAYLGGWTSDRFGRKGAMYINNILFAAGVVCQVVSASVPLLLIGRALVGIGAGATTVVIPVYLGEISPPAYRGMLGACNQLSIVISLLVAELLGIPWGGKDWRLLLGFPIAYSVVQLLMLPFMSESPRWLQTRGRSEDAVKVLIRVTGHDNVTSELAGMREAFEDGVALTTSSNLSDQGYTRLEDGDKYVGGKGGELDAVASSPLLEQDEADAKPYGIADMLRDRGVSRALVVGVLLSFFQQASGINAIFFYSTQFFQSVGIKNALLGSILLGTVNVFATLVSVRIMDKAGRRPLLLIGNSMMLLSFVGLTLVLVLNTSGNQALEYVAIGFMMLAVTAFELGPGPIPWLILGEIFPPCAGATAASVACAVNWTTNFVVGITFQYLNEYLGAYSFAPFGVMLFGATIFTFKSVPETKQRNVEDIIREFSSR